MNTNNNNSVQAYACYTPKNTTLTFYCDDKRTSRPGTTYDLNESGTWPRWHDTIFTNDVSKVVFDPSFADARPTSTCGWFDGMNSLQSITGMEYLNTSEVTSMVDMFSNCSGLTSLDLSNFNTSKVKSMSAMFELCSGLTSLDLSSFNTDNVIDMSEMFDYCGSLTSLDLSNFNTANVINMDYMFSDCCSLKTIFGLNWQPRSRGHDMFYRCYSLIGGQGTTYNKNHVDATYAHIDGGESNPGYFSEK